MSKSDELRQRLLKEAASWLGTPFHHQARVKGAGVDCGQFLIGVGNNLGYIPDVTIEHYPPDFHMHRDREWYIEALSVWCDEIPGPPQPGDVVLFKVGRVYSHGGFVVAWPRMIHSYVSHGVLYANADQGRLAGHPMKFFQPKVFSDSYASTDVGTSDGDDAPSE